MSRKKFKKWSREVIIRDILKLYHRGEYLNSRYVRRRYPKLYNASWRHFFHGSWGEVLEIAGIDVKNINRTREAIKWNRELIVQAIKKLFREGKPLNMEYVSKNYSSLYHAAGYHFEDNWGGAVNAAGFNYESIRRHPRWNKEKLIAKIKEIYKQKKTLKPAFNKTLYASACKHFGSYKNALEAAGFSYEDLCIRSFWNKKRIVKQLARLFEMGIPLNAGYLNVTKPYTGLYRAAIYHFGNYPDALRAAGINPQDVVKFVDLRSWIKRLTDSDIGQLDERIRKLYSNGGGKNEKSA